MAPPIEAVDEAPPSIAGYSQLSLLGSGGFSRVWAATRERDGRDVAIKVLLRRSDPRLSRELAAHELLRPPLVAQLLESGQTSDGYPYFAMDRLRGQVVADWLAGLAEPTPPIDEASILFDNLCRSVDQIHQVGLIHRDLKPENVMRTVDGQVTLLDFGLARFESSDPALGSEDEDLALTLTGSLLGTVTYMAPEQSLGLVKLGRAADIYSLAAIGFELATGRPPFLGDHASVVRAHSWRKPPVASHLASVPAALDDVFSCALAKSPEQRFASAIELAEAFCSALRSSARREPVSVPDTSSRRPMALLSIHGDISSHEIQTTVSSVGGTLARTTAASCVVGFPSAVTVAAGVDAAIAVAEGLRSRAGRCVIHVALVRARSGARGQVLVGDAIRNHDGWDQAKGSGVFLTEPAADLVDAELLERSTESYWALRTATKTEVMRADITPDWSLYDSGRRIFGCEDILSQVVDRAQKSFEGSIPSLTTVIGESGYGKTHLVGHLIEKMRQWKNVRVVGLLSASRDDASHHLRRIVSWALQIEETATAEEIRRVCLDVMPDEAESIWPIAARTLGALSDEEFAQRSKIRDPTAIRQTLARAIGNALRRAATTPLAIIVDDAHRADYTTLDILEHATLAGGRAKLWILVVAGPPLRELRPDWGSRAADAHSTDITPLGDRAARDMLLQRMKPVEFVPDDVLDSLVAMTGGIPSYVEEVANALRLSGAIRQRKGTDTWFVAADDLLSVSKVPLADRLAMTSLSDMSPDMANLTKLCAIVGDSITSRALDALQDALDPSLGFSDIDPTAALSYLCEQRVLRTTRRLAFDFRSPMMRDAVERTIPGPLRIILHRARLRQLESLGETDPARLARHAEGGGETLKAARLYLQHAARAEQRFLYVQSAQAYTAALAYLAEDDSEGRQRAHTGRGRVNRCVGRLQDALDDFGQAMQCAEARADERGLTELLLERATIFDFQFRFANSAAASEKAAELAAGLSDPILSVSCAMARGRSLFREQKVDEAIELLADVAEQSEQLGAYPIRVSALAVLGGALVGIGRLEDAEATLGTMMSLAETVGDRFHMAIAHSNRMLIWTARHDYQHAADDARLALSIATEIGHFPVVWVAKYNLAELLMWMGRFEESERLAREARDVQRRFSEHPDPADTLLLARIQVSRGTVGAATEHVSWLRQRYDSEALSPSQSVLVEMIELWEDGAGPDRWQSLLERSETCSLFDEKLEVLWAFAHVAKREQDGNALVNALARARRLAASGSMWGQRFELLAGGAHTTLA